MDSKGDNASGRGGGDNDNDGGKHPVKNQLPNASPSIALPTSTTGPTPTQSINDGSNETTSQSDIAQATRNSLRDAVGAFPVAGPGIERNNNTNNHNYTNDNLPPNIDIIG